MRQPVRLLIALLCLLAFAPGASAAAQGKTPASGSQQPLNLAAPAAAMQMRGALSPYTAPGGPEADGSDWYIAPIVNKSNRPVTRILLAEEPEGAMLRLMPRAGRAMILQVASSDGGIVIARERAFGAHAFRVTVPAQTRAALALRLANAQNPPSVVAWGEAALVAYHRQLAIFIAAVAGLIAAAAAITGGVAAMTGHAAARWAALALLGVFIIWMAAIGLLAPGWTGHLGGPYGLMALFEGLTLAAALQLVASAVPFSDIWAEAGRYRRWAAIGLVVLALLALAGVPGVALLVHGLVVFGAAGFAAYLVRRGMRGSRAARVLAPSAAVFALVTLAAALAALGAFHDNPLAAKIVGGFAAAGAVLLALATAAGEGLGLMGARPLLQSAAGEPAPQRSIAPIPPAPATLTPADMPAAVAAIGASHQGVYELDFPTDTLHLSPEAAALIGFDRGAQAIPHSAWIGRVHADDRAIYKQALYDYRSHPGLAFRIEFRVRSESGRYPWFELRATMMGDDDSADRCLGLIADVTTRKEAEAAAFDRSQRDALTGLGNRLALIEALEAMAAAPREAACAVLDLDRFKQVHASLGDKGADAVLTHMAERLGKHYRDGAALYRVGGDAFALLFAEGGDAAAELGQDLLALCGQPFTENGRKVFAPASIGIASGRDCDEPLDLLRNAELALRLAKHAGGGTARVYSAEMDGQGPRDAVALEAELRHALDEGQIDIFYQPVMRLSDRAVVGFEALMRWHHPERGLVWPSDFVAHSEESGLIVALGKFALERAAADLARWQRFFPVTPPLFTSVNVSRRQLQDDAFEADLAKVLADNELAPGSLRLEITESAIAANPKAGERLAALKALGAGLAIDDFGTGLSSLSQLRAIPFDTLKVDRSFLARSGSEEGDAEVILSSIVSLAHELKRAVVVEGVENEEDAVRLNQMGCQFAQGFYFSVPLPAREALNFIALHYDAAAPGEEG